MRDKAEKLRHDEILRLKESDKVQYQLINDKINALRESAKGMRLDRIVQLQEAANIARQLSLVNKSEVQLSITNRKSNIPSIHTEINTKQSPLYMLGEKALLAEIEQLEVRESDDPFIPELRSLREKLTLLKHNRNIEVLMNRTNNDAFIEQLREKEAELSSLNLIKLNTKKY